MTVAELLASVQKDAAPPSGLSEEAQALWHAKKGNWEASHNIAQEIHTAMGSSIHALLHLIEGDVGNANYWFHKAHKPTRGIKEIDALWENITQEVLAS
ncbi:hypothetical protein BH11VER1_BH11VER1_02610 [soil metagenome]